MITLFNKSYKACSNLFIEDYEDNKYVFPSPLEFIIMAEKENENIRNRVELIFSNYNSSPLILPYSFNLFAYLLTFEYKINTVLILDLIPVSKDSDSRGYKGIYSYTSEGLTFNLGDTEIYDDYIKKQKTSV